MKAAEFRAYKLAELIEWLHAKDLSRRSTSRGMRRLSPEHFYDPHAATELGALIHTYMSKPARTP